MLEPIFLNTLETHGLQLKQLVQELEETFPSFLPSPSDSDRMIMYKAGQRSVVEWILNKLNENDGQ